MPTKNELKAMARVRKARVVARHEGWAQGKVRPLDIRKGDTVVVLSGKDKGKRGVVERTLPTQQRIVVQGIHIAKRHTRANTSGNAQGGIVDFHAAFAYSKVMLVCSRCDKPTRIKKETDEAGVRHILCMHCGERHERVVEA